MGTVTIELIGLFLFDTSDPAELHIAVIDAEREGVIHGGKELTPHYAFFSADHILSSDWPLNGEGDLELAGTISFDTGGTQPLRTGQWSLPRVAAGCDGMHIPPPFFRKPFPHATHAVISVRSGDLCNWRFEVPDGNGAINTRITLRDLQTFVVTREDGKHVQIDTSQNSHVIFMNTEPVMTPDHRDWYWYFVATGHPCTAEPDDEDIRMSCDPPPNMSPLSLGCSNSQWP